MYVLSRKCDESVIVDGFNGSTRELKVTVLRVEGGRVKLGFEVNSDVSMHRSESRERTCGKLRHDCTTAGAESPVAWSVQ